MREPVNQRGEIVRGVRCPACSADLAGRRAGEPCGGCGGQIAEMLARQMGRLDETGCLTGTSACRRCGYDLRTMPLSTACPECGTVVAESALRMRLGEAPLWWLLTVRRGIDLILIAAVAGLSFPLLFMLSWFFVRGGFVPGILNGLGRDFFRFYYFAVSVLMAFGAMMITTRDPTQFRQRRSRGLMRFFAAAAVILVAAIAVTETSINRSIDAALIFACSIAAIEAIAKQSDKEPPWPEVAIFGLASILALAAGLVFYVYFRLRLVDSFLNGLIFLITDKPGHLEIEPLLVAFVFGPLIFFGTRYVASIVERIPRKRVAWWVRGHGGISGLFFAGMIIAFTGLHFWSSSIWMGNTTSSAPVVPPMLNLLQRLAEFVATVGGWTLGLIAIGIEPLARFAIARAIREAKDLAIAQTGEKSPAVQVSNTSNPMT